MFIGTVINEDKNVDADNSNTQGLMRFVIVLLLSNKGFTNYFPLKTYTSFFVMEADLKKDLLEIYFVQSCVNINFHDK